MTTMQIGALNADIQRSLGAIADDETMLKRVAKYLRRVVKQKEEDPTLMSKEEFFANLDKAEHDIAAGKGKSFDNLSDMNDWLKSL